MDTQDDINEIIEQPPEAEISEEAAETTEESGEAEKTYTKAELEEEKRRERAKTKAITERKLRQQYGQRATPVQEVSSAEPSRTDYENDAQWVKAIAKHELAQERLAARQELVEREQERMVERTEQILLDAEADPTFSRDDFEYLPITEAVASAILESDVAAKLVVYLTNNPNEAEAISRLSPYRQAVEVGKLEAKLSKSVKTTNAPDPIPQRGTGKTVTSVYKSDPDSLDDYAYFKAAQAEKAKRHAR